MGTGSANPLPGDISPSFSHHITPGSIEMADRKQPRYRVTDKRAYIKFGDVQVDAGDLVPAGVEVEDWLVDSGWAVEE